MARIFRQPAPIADPGGPNVRPSVTRGARWNAQNAINLNGDGRGVWGDKSSLDFARDVAVLQAWLNANGFSAGAVDGAFAHGRGDFLHCGRRNYAAFLDQALYIYAS